MWVRDYDNGNVSHLAKQKLTCRSNFSLPGTLEMVFAICNEQRAERTQTKISVARVGMRPLL